MTETLQFKTELKQLLHLIIHSLYSHKDIFLRELISNASDAIDTARFQSLTNQHLLEDNSLWKIQLVPDSEHREVGVDPADAAQTGQWVRAVRHQLGDHIPR